MTTTRRGLFGLFAAAAVAPSVKAAEPEPTGVIYERTWSIQPNGATYEWVPAIAQWNTPFGRLVIHQPGAPLPVNWIDDELAPLEDE